MADRNTMIRGIQIRKGQGLTVDASNLLKVKVEANEGIALGEDGLAVDYDDATIGIISNKLAVKDAGISEAKLDINSAPSDGLVLYWNNSAGKLDYKDVDLEAITESDIVMNEIPTGDINGINTDFALANTPVTGTVCVYLNGLLQEPGSGKDYQISGDTVTFAIAPDTSDIVLCSYFIAEA